MSLILGPVSETVKTRDARWRRLTLCGTSLLCSGCTGAAGSSDELAFLRGGGRGNPFCAGLGIGSAPPLFARSAAAAAATRPTELLISAVAAWGTGQ